MTTTERQRARVLGERRAVLVHVRVVPSHESGGVKSHFREEVSRLDDFFPFGVRPRVERWACCLGDRVIDASADQVGIHVEPRIEVTRLPVKDGAHHLVCECVTDRPRSRREWRDGTEERDDDVLQFISESEEAQLTIQNGFGCNERHREMKRHSGVWALQPAEDAAAAFLHQIATAFDRVGNLIALAKPVQQLGVRNDLAPPCCQIDARLQQRRFEFPKRCYLFEESSVLG